MCPHARCIMHVHSIYATTLASLEECILPPINQVASMFFGRQVVDKKYGGLAFEEEGERCANLLSDPKKHTFIMGNHGILIFGQNVAETFNRLYYFERAAKVYINALQSGKKISILNDEIAEKTAQELDDEEHPLPAGTAFLREIKLILDNEGSDYYK
jgi:ribulose-5-phosphate 4-epimerase/fuculose-1-phosphate aldolase